MSAAGRSSSPNSSSWCEDAAICAASADLENIVLRAEGGTPLLLKDVARVELGPDERRGITELNGEGEVASGIALQRYGANALTVIDNVKVGPGADGDQPAARASRSFRFTTARSLFMRRSRR